VSPVYAGCHEPVARFKRIGPPGYVGRSEPCARSWCSVSGPSYLAMAHFVFTCPATSMNVQHFLENDQDAPDNEYEGISCPACAKLHFVNRKTGKLLGEDK
jgi:hypothetical protein